MQILIHLEQSKTFSNTVAFNNVSNLDLQYNGNTKFGKQRTIKVNHTDLSNHQKQLPETKDSVTEVDRLKGYSCSKSVFNLNKKVLDDT